MGILSAVWALKRAYDPNAQIGVKRTAVRFGAFQPEWKPPAWHRRPRNDAEAQKLYNHIRSVAFYLDAAPVLSDLGLPLRVGLDDLISLIPIWGDVISGLVQLYQVWLCWIFGMGVDVCWRMILNVILDIVVGVVPFVGNLLDNLFKANLRNLALLEDWLLSPQAEQYHILLMPDTNTFLPAPKHRQSRWSAWFGPTGNSSREDEREREHQSGKVRRTRRMDKDEGEYGFGKGPVGGDAGGATVEPLD